jgi:hypothetical protein
MAQIDEDLRDILRMEAAWGAIYADATPEAHELRAKIENACTNFVHTHAYKILGLYHLHEMDREQARIDDFMRRSEEKNAVREAVERVRLQGLGGEGHSNPTSAEGDRESDA